MKAASAPFRVVPLAAQHDRVAFACGNPALDHYFKSQVSQDVKRRAASCFVALGSSQGIAKEKRKEKRGQKRKEKKGSKEKKKKRKKKSEKKREKKRKKRGQVLQKEKKGSGLAKQHKTKEKRGQVLQSNIEIN